MIARIKQIIEKKLSLFQQEALVLGSVGSVSCPLPLHRFPDNRIRGQPKSHVCARSPLKPPYHPVQLLRTLHTAHGTDEEQQVKCRRYVVNKIPTCNYLLEPCNTVCSSHITGGTYHIPEKGLKENYTFLSLLCG